MSAKEELNKVYTGGAAIGGVVIGIWFNSLGVGIIAFIVITAIFASSGKIR